MSCVHSTLLATPTGSLETRSSPPSSSLCSPVSSQCSVCMAKGLLLWPSYGRYTPCNSAPSSARTQPQRFHRADNGIREQSTTAFTDPAGNGSWQANSILTAGTQYKVRRAFTAFTADCCALRYSWICVQSSLAIVISGFVFNLRLALLFSGFVFTLHLPFLFPSCHLPIHHLSQSQHSITPSLIGHRPSAIVFCRRWHYSKVGNYAWGPRLPHFCYWRKAQTRTS